MDEEFKIQVRHGSTTSSVDTKLFDWVFYNSKIKTRGIAELEDASMKIVKVLESMVAYYQTSVPKINLLANIINNLSGISKDFDTFHNTIMNIDTLKSVGAGFTGTVKQLTISSFKVSQVARAIYENLRMIYASTLKLERKKNEGIITTKNLVTSSNSVELLEKIVEDPEYIALAQSIMIAGKELENMMNEMIIFSKEAITNLATVYEMMKMSHEEFSASKNSRVEDSVKETISREFAHMMPHVKKYVSMIIQHDKLLTKLFNNEFKDSWKKYVEENSFDPAFNVRGLVSSSDPEDMIIAATKMRNALEIQVSAAKKELDDLKLSEENKLNIKIAGISDPEYARFRAYNLAIKDLHSGREKSLRIAIDGLSKCVSLGGDQIDSCVRKLPKIMGNGKNRYGEYISAVKHVDGLRDNVNLQKRIIDALKMAAKNPDLDKPTAVHVDGFVEKQFQAESTKELSEKLSLASKVMHEESVDDLEKFDRKINNEINHLKNQKNINKSFLDQVVNATDVDDLSIAASGAYGTAFAAPFEYYGGCLTCTGGKTGGSKGRVSNNLFVKDDNRYFFPREDPNNPGDVIMLYMTEDENKMYAEKMAKNKYMPEILEIRNQHERGLIDKKIAAQRFEEVRKKIVGDVDQIRKAYYTEPSPKGMEEAAIKLRTKNKEILGYRFAKSISKYSVYYRVALESFKRILDESNILIYATFPNKDNAKKIIDILYATIDARLEYTKNIDYTKMAKDKAFAETYYNALINGIKYDTNRAATIFGADLSHLENLLDAFIAAHYKKLGKSYDGGAEKVFKAFKGLPIYKLLTNVNIHKLNFDWIGADIVLSSGKIEINFTSEREKLKQFYIFLKYRSAKIVKQLNNFEFILKSIFKLLCNMNFIQICIALKFAILYPKSEYLQKNSSTTLKKIERLLYVYDNIIRIYSA
jgi:hypothetical protein